MFSPNRVKIVTIYKNFFTNHDFFLNNFFKSLINSKEPDPEPQFVISAPAGNLFSAPRLSAPQH